MAVKKLELTVGELAIRAGVAPSAVRYYEDRGLIFSRRTSGNQRRYHRAMLRRVAFIRASQAVGIPLATIGSVLEVLGEHESPTKAMWHKASVRWMEDLDERIALLQRMRDLMDGCVGCGCLSMKACQLLNPGDVFAQQGTGTNRLLTQECEEKLEGHEPAGCAKPSPRAGGAAGRVGPVGSGG
jgi:MerR family transcriptional regulator, redox-sensitive transcriptional activator SoxR